jgi:predicted amidohydrolase
MRISVIQPDIKWHDKRVNLSTLESLAQPLYSNTDLVILPEMFSTGFTMEPELLSEPMDGETLDWMRKMADKGNFGICGSYIVSEEGKFFNRWVFVSPDKSLYYYDKRHLFSLAEENMFYKAGKKRLVFEFRGFKISPYVCYDLRFPVWSRNRGEYDLAIYSANWPEVRVNVWNTLLRARAIENQCFVAGSNRIGADGKGIRHNGNSCIINARGELLSAAGESACSISTDLSLQELTDFRNKFNVFRDADEFEISM